MGFILNDIIDNTQWRKYKDPVPHVVGENVFKKEIYLDLVRAYNNCISLLNSENSPFGIAHKKYDANIMGIDFNSDPAFHIFLSKEWHDMLASLFNINANGNIDISIHHHKVGSRTGWIHSDLVMGRYLKKENSGEITVLGKRLLNYKESDVYETGYVAEENVRVLAMIYYLNNEFNSIDDGGCTALYKKVDQDADKPSCIIPPINNSILAFPCTPYSYHTFISNKKYPRSSIIMWLHYSRKEPFERWGENKITKWDY